MDNWNRLVGEQGPTPRAVPCHNSPDGQALCLPIRLPINGQQAISPTAGTNPLPAPPISPQLWTSPTPSNTFRLPPLHAIMPSHAETAHCVSGSDRRLQRVGGNQIGPPISTTTGSGSLSPGAGLSAATCLISVEQPLLEKLLTAALWAPSAHNRQPWRFLRCHFRTWLSRS